MTSPFLSSAAFPVPGSVDPGAAISGGYTVSIHPECLSRVSPDGGEKIYLPFHMLTFFLTIYTGDTLISTLFGMQHCN